MHEAAAGKARAEACRARIEEATHGERDSRVLAADERLDAPREAPSAKLSVVEAGGPSTPAAAATSKRREASLGPDGALIEMHPHRRPDGDEVKITGVRQRPTHTFKKVERVPVACIARRAVLRPMHLGTRRSDENQG
jgi:hypothetical protein